MNLGQGQTRNVAQYPLNHMTYAPAKFEDAMSNGLGGKAFYKKTQYLTYDLDLGVKVMQNVSQYPLHHVTYPATKFEVVTSNRLGGDTFKRKYII